MNGWRWGRRVVEDRRQAFDRHVGTSWQRALLGVVVRVGFWRRVGRRRCVDDPTVGGVALGALASGVTRRPFIAMAGHTVDIPGVVKGIVTPAFGAGTSPLMANTLEHIVGILRDNRPTSLDAPFIRMATFKVIFKGRLFTAGNF